MSSAGFPNKASRFYTDLLFNNNEKETSSSNGRPSTPEKERYMYILLQTNLHTIEHSCFYSIIFDMTKTKIPVE